MLYKLPSRTNCRIKHRDGTGNKVLLKPLVGIRVLAAHVTVETLKVDPVVVVEVIIIAEIKKEIAVLISLLSTTALRQYLYQPLHPLQHLLLLLHQHLLQHLLPHLVEKKS
jgi:hypothetical protein